MAKVDPYLRPLYDALYDLLGPDGAQRLLERGTIEVAPLAFMRGRTLNRSFIILDEAQNTSPEQMKMFLTRIGFGSKAVVTGDVTQVDVPGGRSGLFGLESILGAVDGVAFVHLGQRDVVRHRIVADIVAAYERADVERAAGDAVKRASQNSPAPLATDAAEKSAASDGS
jgi:phosphate starvation-inducible PhoH-like protein